MKRAELQAGNMVAVTRGGYTEPAIVLTTEPWEEYTTYMGRMFGTVKTGKFSRATGGSGVAVAIQARSGQDLVLKPAVVQLQQIVDTWESEQVAKAEEAKRKAARERIYDDQAALISGLPANLKAARIMVNDIYGDSYYMPKSGRVEVNLNDLVELVKNLEEVTLAYHRVSYEFDQ